MQEKYYSRYCIILQNIVNMTLGYIKIPDFGGHLVGHFEFWPLF
jgi:hypothetical protein